MLPSRYERDNTLFSVLSGIRETWQGSVANVTPGCWHCFKLLASKLGGLLRLGGGGVLWPSRPTPPTHPEIQGLLWAILGKYRHLAEEQGACAEACPSHSDSVHRSTAHMCTHIHVHTCPTQPTQGLSLVQQDDARLLRNQERDKWNGSEFAQGC